MPREFELRSKLDRGSFDSAEVITDFPGKKLSEVTSVESLVSRGGLRTAALASPKQKYTGVSQDTPIKRSAFSA